MDTDQLDKLAQDLGQEDEQLRWKAIVALAEAANRGENLSSAIPALIETLSDPYDDIRQQAAYTLVSVVEHGGDITAAIPALAKALFDESLEVRKEAVWALYCLVYEGSDIEVAAPGLVDGLQSPSQSVRGNGAIALTLHYLNTGRTQEAGELLEHADGAVIFGASWGHIDFYRKKEDKAGLQGLVQRIRPGLLDLGMQNGVAGALDWARTRGEDISFALSAIHELIQGSNDPLQQAPLYGILMKLDRRD
jgi:HEAT repeat protein